MHQQNHTSSIDLCVVTGFSSPEQWKSIRLFEGVNCWSVTSSECVYCQVSAPRNWMVSFVPRRSVSVSAAGGGVSTIWTPRVIETWLILSESLLAIYTLFLNGMWEWIRIHALWIMVWCSVCIEVACVRIHKTHSLRVICAFYTQKTLPDFCIIYWNILSKRSKCV